MRSRWRDSAPRALLLAPAAWVATEFAAHAAVWRVSRGRCSGTRRQPCCRSRSAPALVGVFGLSFLVVLGRPRSRRRSPDGIGPGSSRWRLTAAARARPRRLWGSARLADGRLTRTGTQVRVGLVQGNVAQDQKWDPELEDEILGRYLALSRQAADRGARAILWPESARRSTSRTDRRARPSGCSRVSVAPPCCSAATRSDRSNPRDLVQLRVHGAPRRQHRGRLPQGAPRAVRRVRAVAARCCSSRRRWSRPSADFAPGEAPRDAAARRQAGEHGDLLRSRLPCARSATACSHGSALLTTITNDAWFGRSSAPCQHFAMASMRAIEAGPLPRARPPTPGISGIVDPYGRVVSASDLFVDQVLVGDVRLLDERTLYAQTGDVVAYASVVVTIVALAFASMTRAPITVRRRRERSTAAGPDSSEVRRGARARRAGPALSGSGEARVRAAELSLRPPARPRN